MRNEKFLPGFVDALVGAVAGEERNFQLTLPVNYAEKSLAGNELEGEMRTNASRTPGIRLGVGRIEQFADPPQDLFLKDFRASG